MKRLTGKSLTVLSVAFSLVVQACGPAAPAAPAGGAATAPPAAAAAPASQPTVAPALPTIIPTAAANQQFIPLTGQFAGVGAQPVTLRYLDVNGSPDDEGHTAMINEFQKQYPNITIKRESVTYDELWPKIQTEFASSAPADILEADGPAVTAYAAENALLPLDDYVTADDRKDFYPDSLQEGEWNGHIYGLAQEQSAMLLYYRTDDFAAAGVDPPKTLKDGWTWAQALDALTKVTKRPAAGAVPTEYGINLQINSYFNAIYARSAGDRTAPKDSSLYKTFASLSPDGQSVKGYIDSEEAIAAMQTMQTQLFNAQVAPRTFIPDGMYTGKSAAEVGAEWEEGTLLLQYKNLKWGASPLPFFKSGFTHTGSFEPVVSVKSQHPKEAALFVKWWTSPETEQLWFSYNPQLAGPPLDGREAEVHLQPVPEDAGRPGIRAVGRDPHPHTCVLAVRHAGQRVVLEHRQRR